MERLPDERLCSEAGGNTGLEASNVTDTETQENEQGGKLSEGEDNEDLEEEEEEDDEEEESDENSSDNGSASSFQFNKCNVKEDVENDLPDVKRRKVAYEEKNIEDAVNWLNTNGGTVSDAAKRFNIPRSTLRFRLKSTDPVGQRKSGAPPALSAEEEQLVVDWVLETARMGQPPSWKRLSIAVKEMLDRCGHTKVFANNNMPSSGWLRAFKKRHPNLSTAKTEEMNVPDTFTKEDIKKWFIELQTHLKEEGLDPQTFLQPHNGNRIYNSEEVVVMLQGEDRLSKVLSQKGKRNVPKFCSPGRKMITVMTCISAAGSYLRPFIVFEGRKIPLQQLQQQVDPTLFDVGFSKRGGIDHELFSVWIEGLINYLDYHSIQRPVLLLLDSHTCHINLNSCEMAKEAGLIMHLLPPHASHLMQPVDVGIFKTLKTAYRDSVDHFIPTHGPAINKKHFPLVFVNAWHTAAIKENAINGFKEAGLVPLNLEMIDTTKIPARSRSMSTDYKNAKERAPGRPLHKGSKPPKRTLRPPGNDYIRGLSDALDHIIHNFVSDKVRPIYQQWIIEEKSCTPDPVFYIWGSLKTLIEENKKKQQKYDQTTASSDRLIRKTECDVTQMDPVGVRGFNATSREQQVISVSTPPSASQTQHTSIRPQQTPTAVKDQTPQCLYTQQEPKAPVAPHSQRVEQFNSPHSMTVTHATQQMVPPWDHNMHQNFNRYFTGSHPHTHHEVQNSSGQTMTTTVTAEMHIHRTIPPPPPPALVTSPQMLAPPQHAGHYYASVRSKDSSDPVSKEVSSQVPAVSKESDGIKRQWLSDKEELENNKRIMTRTDDDTERNQDEKESIYDSQNNSNYSARIGMCMQEVVPQDLCQLQYQEE